MNRTILVMVTLISSLVFISPIKAETVNFVPTSGTDATEVESALTPNDLSRLSSSNDTRMASNAAWPGEGSFDETKFLEFIFTTSIPEEAIITSVTVTHEFKRSTILAGAKLKVWDGDSWHDFTLELPMDTINDVAQTIDVSSILSTHTVLKNTAIRFLAYRNTAASSAKTSHDYTTIEVSYVVSSTPTPTPEPTDEPVESTPIPTVTPTPTPTPTMTPTALPLPTPTAFFTPIPTPIKTPSAPKTPVPTVSVIPSSSPLTIELTPLLRNSPQSSTAPIKTPKASKQNLNAAISKTTSGTISPTPKQIIQGSQRKEIWILRAVRNIFIFLTQPLSMIER